MIVVAVLIRQYCIDILFFVCWFIYSYIYMRDIAQIFVVYWFIYSFIYMREYCTDFFLFIGLFTHLFVSGSIAHIFCFCFFLFIGLYIRLFVCGICVTLIKNTEYNAPS